MTTATAPPRPDVRGAAGAAAGGSAAGRRPDEAGDRALLLEQGPAIAAAAMGSSPEDLRVDVEAVHHRPGAGIGVVYRVRTGALDERLVASTAPPRATDQQDRVVTLADDDRSLRVWWRRDDPALPGLRAALDADVVGRWLGGTTARLEILSYRPGRRAVVLADAGTRRAFLKIVRPDRALALRRRHDLVPAAPPVLAEPAPGVVVLGVARGSSLAQVLAGGDPAALPDPLDVLHLLDRLPDVVTTLEARPSWSDRVDFHAAAARAELPACADRIDAVERRVRAALAAVPARPPVPTHGDLNVANLFVDGGSPVALIDVDSIGPGRRSDDLATLLAHLRVLPDLAPRVYPRVAEVADRWTAAFARHTDPAELAARTAAVLLSLVAGAGPAQAHARLRLAEQQLDDPTAPAEATR